MKKKTGEEEGEYLWPPPYSPQEQAPPPPVSDESSLQLESPVVRRSTQKRNQKEEKLYPLREVLVPGAGAAAPRSGYVSVPLNTSDVREFKKEMGNLLEDPLGVSERLDQFLGPNL